MRRHEIDWIRNISILMLFAYHTAAIFCKFGDFYIVSEQKNLLADLLIIVLFVWYMPMLFFLAGASTHFSLENRSLKDYMKERVKKLLVPLIFGIIVVVPPQTYLARIWRGETNLNYFEHLKYFFTNINDFSGFDGAFTPAHLWFILYLFVVSIIGGFIIYKIFKGDCGEKIINIIKSIFFDKFSILTLLTLGVISDLFPSIMGKSILGCLIVFIFGYITYKDITLIEKIQANKFKFLLIFIGCGLFGVLYTFLMRPDEVNTFIWVIDSLFKNTLLISAIGAVVAFSSIYLNKSNKVLRYLNRSAFAVYIIHQPILLALAFIIIPLIKSTTLSMILIIVLSTAITFIAYEILRRIKIFNKVLIMR